MESIYDKNTTCCFTGHRFVPDDEGPQIKARLKKCIEELAKDGVLTFISGGALGFDTLAALTVLELKQKNPQISLVMALPCRDQHQRWSERDKFTYEEILKVADDIYFLSESYCTGCMHLRNKFMVQQSSRCIAYYTGKNGGTAHTLRLAREYGLTVLNVADI